MDTTIPSVTYELPGGVQETVQFIQSESGFTLHYRCGDKNYYHTNAISALRMQVEETERFQATLRYRIQFPGDPDFGPADGFNIKKNSLDRELYNLTRAATLRLKHTLSIAPMEVVDPVRNYHRTSITSLDSGLVDRKLQQVAKERAKFLPEV